MNSVLDSFETISNMKLLGNYEKEKSVVGLEGLTFVTISMQKYSHVPLAWANKSVALYTSDHRRDSYKRNNAVWPALSRVASF